MAVSHIDARTFQGSLAGHQEGPNSTPGEHPLEPLDVLPGVIPGHPGSVSLTFVEEELGLAEQLYTKGTLGCIKPVLTDIPADKLIPCLRVYSLFSLRDSIDMLLYPDKEAIRFPSTNPLRNNNGVFFGLPALRGGATGTSASAAGGFSALMFAGGEEAGPPSVLASVDLGEPALLLRSIRPCTE